MPLQIHSKTKLTPEQRKQIYQDKFKNQTKIWDLAEMDADHVAAWSKGGIASVENCQMLCKTHNRAKGNK